MSYGSFYTVTHKCNISQKKKPYYMNSTLRHYFVEVRKCLPLLYSNSQEINQIEVTHNSVRYDFSLYDDNIQGNYIITNEHKMQII